jgi:flagellar basal body-associated protein FliL
MTTWREREEDMARKKIGKRGTAIIVLMVVAAIAGSPSTAAATPRPTASSSAPAPAPAVVTSPVLASWADFASWAEASWAEE